MRTGVARPPSVSAARQWQSWGCPERAGSGMGRSTLFDDCMAQMRGQALSLGVFSFAANLLLLISSIYMTLRQICH
jgi:hypothetical protein